MPAGYTGSVAGRAEAAKDITEQQKRNGGELEAEEEEEQENGEEFEKAQALEEVASFDKLVLWGHESLVEGDDPFVKGVEEWIGFADAVSPAFVDLGRGKGKCTDDEGFDRCINRGKKVGLEDLGLGLGISWRSCKRFRARSWA